MTNTSEPKPANSLTPCPFGGNPKVAAQMGFPSCGIARPGPFFNDLNLGKSMGGGRKSRRGGRKSRRGGRRTRRRGRRAGDPPASSFVPGVRRVYAPAPPRGVGNLLSGIMPSPYAAPPGPPPLQRSVPYFFPTRGGRKSHRGGRKTRRGGRKSRRGGEGDNVSAESPSADVAAVQAPVQAPATNKQPAAQPPAPKPQCPQECIAKGCGKRNILHKIFGMSGGRKSRRGGRKSRRGGRKSRK